MSIMHRAFFKGTEEATQLHVPSGDHVTIHPSTLHLWRPRSKMRRIPWPPKSLI
jgi:hypothetical protein